MALCWWTHWTIQDEIWNVINLTYYPQSKISFYLSFPDFLAPAKEERAWLMLPAQVWLQLEKMTNLCLEECSKINKIGFLVSILAGEFFEYWMCFKGKTHSGTFFFFSCLLRKVLICIRLSRVMTFNVINVTSIIPLNLSCLHLQNVNVSDYMTILETPRRGKKRNTGLSVVGRPTR